MSLKDKQAELDQFIGTEGYTRWSPLLFRRMVLTDGAKFVAENGGAYWLMDAIASHQPKALKNPLLRYIQFWTLEVKEKKNGSKSAVLTCCTDSGEKPTITQKFAHTDFDLPKIDLWVEPMDENTYVILLPSEH